MSDDDPMSALVAGYEAMRQAMLSEEARADAERVRADALQAELCNLKESSD